MSSEETCGNIKALKAAKIESLCNTCRKKSSCLYSYSSDLIGKKVKVPGVRIEHITGVCLHGYEKIRTVDRAGEEINPSHPNEGNLSPRLHGAKVKDRCLECPVEVKDGCERRQELDKLTDISQKAGTWIEFKVVCCNQSERLYQISEPRKWV